ncbi:MAG: hypothetical protein LBF87_08365 [Treponema sp.]|nr:hypothetical protein [Treponema sp.]
MRSAPDPAFEGMELTHSINGTAAAVSEINVSIRNLQDLDGQVRGKLDR